MPEIELSRVDIVEFVRSDIARHGSASAARRLGIHRGTMQALASGANVRDGTLALAAQCVQRLQRREESAGARRER